jgi:hypothetical protein
MYLLPSYYSVRKGSNAHFLQADVFEISHEQIQEQLSKDMRDVEDLPTEELNMILRGELTALFKK